MQEPVESVEWSAFRGGMTLECRQSTRLWRVVHSHYAISVVDQARADWSYRHTEFTFEPGAVYVCEPGEVHTTRRISGPGDFAVVFLEPELVNERAAELGLSTPHFAPGRIESQGLYERFSAVRRALAAGQAEGLEQGASLLLGELLGQVAPSPSNGEPEACVIERARDYLRDLVASRPGSVVRLQPVAAELGVSYHSLIHGFSRKFGVPPYEFVNQLRANHVRADLQRGPDEDCPSLTALARRWGYVDGPHLSRIFRRYYRISPSEMARIVNPSWLKRTSARGRDTESAG